jgi:hypothetical protein
MKALLAIVPLGLALVGCSTYIEPAPTAVVASPAVVAAAPVYVQPALSDMDRDGTPDIHDRFPNDWRYR